jgi:YHS domain-containing protein
MSRKGYLWLAGAVLAALPLVAANAKDEEKALPKEVDCAVQTGNKVNVEEATRKGMYRDYEYGRYYFCCGGCPGAFDKSPEKFAKNASVALSSIALPTELACAVMGDHKANLKEATEKGLYADHNGRRYYFCCAGCPAAFKADPAKFSKSASVAVGQLPLPKETTCAVMSGNKVKVADALAKGMYADYKGKRYLFCCAGCPAAFKADPEKFTKNASIPSPKVEKKEAETK